MPRRNLYLLVCVLAVSFVSYHKADSANRTHYEPMFDVFKTAMSEIREHYLYADNVDERKLFEGAMRGMTGELDPYSGYSGYKETREFDEGLHQEFGGIGIEVNWNRETKTLSVMSPIVGTPAYEAGIMAGDIITKINDEKTEDFTDSDDAVNRIKGKPGEPVRLTVIHRGETEEHELTLVRAKIKVDTVLGDRRNADGTWDYTLESDPAIGYVRITQFGDKTVDELGAALQQCRDKNVRGLILDLRNDPGGLLDAAYKVCDYFVSSGIIVTIRERGGRERERREATGAAQYTDWPMAVLVNQYSASASEIVSACLQDHHRAIVVGERSYGKGTVQTPIRLENGKSMMRLTIASYWRPSNENIHRAKGAKEEEKWGVQPDKGYEVKLDEKQLIDLLRHRRERDVLRRPGEKPAHPVAAATPTGTPEPAPPKPTVPTGGGPPLKSSDTRAPTHVSPDDDESPSGDSADPQLAKAVEYLKSKIGK
ncbi:MAG: S41 family peptidase [Pirellula sp.]|nr:S41 family peptidase [Pirellula sp.]